MGCATAAGAGAGAEAATEAAGCAADAAATVALTELQLRILAHLVPKLASQSTVQQALWAVASIGGHMRGNGEPGWQILYRGLAKLMALEEGWLLRDGAA